MKYRKLTFLLAILFAFSAETSERFQNFTKMLVGKSLDSRNSEYNNKIGSLSSSFSTAFIYPIKTFSSTHIQKHGKTIFYPFAGADISYPLLLFPQLEQYVLVGLEFPGNPDFVGSNFDLNKFFPQAEGYLKSGFFKTMNMSSQMFYNQGVIPMLVFQIGLLGGEINNIEPLTQPFKGITINFTFQGELKKLYYFRANLDDSTNKEDFFNFLDEKKLTDNCMLKASSYKLQQPEFKQLLNFVIDKCSRILQDDTGVAVNKLIAKKYSIELFGDYAKPYGSEFIGYNQPELLKAYKNLNKKIPIGFCYGYGCSIVEANILLARKTVLH